MSEIFQLKFTLKCELANTRSKRYSFLSVYLLTCSRIYCQIRFQTHERPNIPGWNCTKKNIFQLNWELLKCLTTWRLFPVNRSKTITDNK